MMGWVEVNAGIKEVVSFWEDRIEAVVVSVRVNMCASVCMLACVYKCLCEGACVSLADTSWLLLVKSVRTTETASHGQ